MRTAPFASLRSLFSITDEQAMWRVQNDDDERAFAQLVHRWEGPIQRLCVRMTGDAHRAEDLAQDAFSRVFAKRKDYQPSGRFSTWLWRIALNLCYDELRRRHRREESSLDAMCGEAFAAFVAPEAAPDRSLVDQERGELVRKALMQLPETYRTVLVLRHYENLKFREIADVLDVPEGTVKSRMAEALTQLSRLLKPMLAEPHIRPDHFRRPDRSGAGSEGEQLPGTQRQLLV
jgi:RNA polymerase sigma-70 factor, ECF subfamily